MFFQLVLGSFSDLKNQNNYNSNWKKILGFRNLQEKLENSFFSYINDQAQAAVTQSVALFSSAELTSTKVKKCLVTLTCHKVVFIIPQKKNCTFSRVTAHFLAKIIRGPSSLRDGDVHLISLSTLLDNRVFEIVKFQALSKHEKYLFSSGKCIIFICVGLLIIKSFVVFK